jgi:hypothetical protein
MLRSWHEDAKVYEVWEKLRLIVVQSIEDYDSSYIDRSPFGNVGSVFKLPEFTEAQVQDLAERYKLNYDQTQVQQLMSLIGGHPYLIRLAIDHLTDGETLENFLNNAPTNDGIYGDYLRRIFSKLQRSPHLSTAFKQVVTATEPVAIPTNTEYQLYSMGLVERAKKGNKFIPRCQLYRQYFQEHL